MTLRNGFPAVGPTLDRLHHFLQFVALAGEGVLDANRGLGKNAALDDVAGFEFFEPAGEETVAEALDGACDLAEATGLCEEHSDDEGRPPLAQDLDRRLVARTHLFAEHGVHLSSY